MKIVIKHRVISAVAANLQVANDIFSSLAGEEKLDIVAAAAAGLGSKKTSSSKAAKILNDPKSETFTVVLNDDMLIELLGAQGDLLKAVAGLSSAVKLYPEVLARISKKYDKKGSF